MTRINGEEVIFHSAGVTIGAEFLEHRPEHAFVAKSSADPDTCECGKDILDPLHQLELPL